MEEFYEYDKWFAMRWAMLLTNLGVISCKHENHRECATENEAHICGKCLSAESVNSCQSLVRCTYYIRFITYISSMFKCDSKEKFAELSIFCNRWRHANTWKLFFCWVWISFRRQREWTLFSLNSASSEYE